MSDPLKGAVAEWLKSSPLASKVQGSRQLEALSLSLCSLSKGWVPGSLES